MFSSELFAAITFDGWVLAFSLVTVVVTIGMGFWSARTSKTAGDFFVAGRSVSVGWNASAISGEYLSAASFMGVAGMVMKFGYDALWYPVCYACGYLFLLLFIAGPLRRFGAYTIPDFAEGRFDSPVFRKIAVCFVLFIGFFYTMPQMKGAGVALSYIFKGMPYWAGVVLVGAVITFNVALGGMKGITLVQAFQYWLKMFAISVPIFVLMSVYGFYNEQIRINSTNPAATPNTANFVRPEGLRPAADGLSERLTTLVQDFRRQLAAPPTPVNPEQTLPPNSLILQNVPLENLLRVTERYLGKRILLYPNTPAPIGFQVIVDQPTKVRNVQEILSARLREGGIALIPHGADLLVAAPVTEESRFREILASYEPSESARKPLPAGAPGDAAWISPFGALTTKAAAAAGLAPEEQRRYSLIYTYSLIIALVCGTAGLPHILVRFYTNPNGVAAKRTTMWVMILIGIFYVFPPIFGAMGRNLLPELYAATGAKGTDKVVLELPIILNQKVPMLGSILSGVTCAGAFAAFMSTFSGLLVSMTGALAHDVYGRMLRPKATATERLRAFKVAAVLIGTIAVLLGMQVEKLDINYMVGQAFAIAAASYFPLLFMSAWWRGMTMKGAATGMLTGGLLALGAISLTSFSDLGWIQMAEFWKAHPLMRILCEQPAIWAVPLAITLMVVVSKLTRSQIPSDVRMKMLVLHAPETLGLKQEYIQEHQAGMGH